MKKTVKMALSAAGFAVLALSTMPAGSALAQSSNLEREVCTSALRGQCEQDVHQIADCCLHPEVNGCGIRVFGDVQGDAKPGEGSGVVADTECLAREAQALLACRDCDFPEQPATAAQ
jgi:hypothetical protein